MKKLLYMDKMYIKDNVFHMLVCFSKIEGGLVRAKADFKKKDSIYLFNSLTSFFFKFSQSKLVPTMCHIAESRIARNVT